ncbi:MAG: hypothetical protein JNL88_11850 [Bacteroidia bacterium]|nr:hypothetical protein [Bacteroidia bacterium]
MKNLICLLLIVSGTVLSGPLFAQNQKKQHKELSAEQRADKRTELLKTKLLLSDEQSRQVHAAALHMEQNRSNEKGKMRAGREEFESSLRSILNPEQLEKYEALREEKKEQVKQRVEERRNQDKMKQEKETENQNDPVKN